MRAPDRTGYSALSCGLLFMFGVVLALVVWFVAAVLFPAIYR